MSNSRLYLNDLLHMPNLKNVKIKFNQYNGNVEPMEEYKRDPDLVNIQWLFWRAKRRYFNAGEIAICLFQLSSDTWLLSTIKKVTKELNITDGVNYEGEEVEQYKPYYGRVIIKYHKSHQTQVRCAEGVIDNLEVLQILPSTFDGVDFPGYDKVRLTFSQLEIIIKRNKPDWISALENQKAVYLITDTSNGRHYVGSATGDNGMLLQRWRSYVENGHGGNKELIKIVNQEGFEYVREKFQYAILENYNARVDKHIILERESWWKETLGTREFGYNSN